MDVGLKTACVIAAALSCACQDPGGTLGTACRASGRCVDCHAVCQRMVECEVSYAVGGEPLPVVEDTDSKQGQCERGCVTTDAISPQRASCILDVDSSDPGKCQQQILVCLGVDGGVEY